MPQFLTQKSVSGKKKMEKLLEEERRKNESIIDLNPYAIAIGDTKGFVIKVNKAFVRLFGSVPPPQYNIFKDPLLAEAGYKKLFERLAKGEVVEFPLIKYNAHKVIPKSPDVDIYIRTVMFPVKGISGKIEYFIGMHEDFTMEHEIDKAKTEFISLVSHQLRTPLTGVAWNAEILLKDNKIGEPQKALVRQIYRSNKRMIALINLLLNVTRVEMRPFNIDPQPTNILDIVDSVLKGLGPEIRKNKIKIIKKIRIRDPILVIDKDVIRIILQNLLGNAVGYSSKNGEVLCEIVKKNSDILIKIADKGCGISKNDQKRMFSKLFRADNAQKMNPDGNGLGLYVVKSILDSIDGKIWFDSTEGKGSTFYVSFPLTGMRKKSGTESLI